MTTLEHRGLWPALLTPLNADGSIHHTRLLKHAQRLLAAGCTGVTLFGTTGEGPSFAVIEREHALQTLIDGGLPAERITVHTSCANLPETVALTRHATALGVHGCLVLPPFFLKGVPDAGVLAFYDQVIQAVADERLRVVVYNIPQVSGVAVSVPVIRDLLARHPDTVIGIKDSGCQREASVAYAQAFMPPLQVWVGNEPDLPELATLGGAGAISGIANMMPRLVTRLFSSTDPAQIQADLARVKAFLGLIGGYGMTAAFKGVMAVIDGDEGWLPVRAPLCTLSSAEMNRLREQLRDFGLDTERD
jgi:4-hydroxy-tetrahydrodipicolinate synthase